MKLDRTWTGRAILASQFSRWVVETYDDWRSSAVTDILYRLLFIISDWSGRRGVPRSLKLLFRMSTHVNQWILNGDVDYCCLREARCLIDHSFEIHWSTHSRLTFQQPDHGRARARRKVVPHSIDDDGDGFLPGQRHAIVSAILLLRLNVVHQQSLDAASITIRDSWALLSLLFQHTKNRPSSSSRHLCTADFLFEMLMSLIRFSVIRICTCNWIIQSSCHYRCYDPYTTIKLRCTKDITSRFRVSNGSPSATKMCIYSCTSASDGCVNVAFVISRAGLSML